MISHVTSPECPPDLPERLAAKGAVLSYGGDGGQPMLIGDWACSGSRRVFAFPAHGNVGDEHVFEFDEAVLLDTQIVGFLRGGQLVAQLSAIGAASLTDPDDYRVAWQIWQQVAPMVRGKIVRCRERLDPDF